MRIDDAFLEKLRHMKTRIRGILYVVDDTPGFIKGDVVLDREDGLHAVIDMVVGDRCALRDGMLVQVNVPLSRLVKLRQVTFGQVTDN